MKHLSIILLIFFSVKCFSQDWKPNFETACSEALASNKNILLVFSGSDWCAPCIKLDKNIWKSEAFKKYADNLVLYKADFPKKKNNQLDPRLKTENLALAEKYNPEGNYPLVVLMDKNRKILGYLGYLNLDAEAYIERIKKLQ